MTIARVRNSDLVGRKGLSPKMLLQSATLLIELIQIKSVKRTMIKEAKKYNPKTLLELIINPFDANQLPVIEGYAFVHF